MQTAASAEVVPFATHHTISGVRAAMQWLDAEIEKAGGRVTTQIIDLTPDLAAALLDRNTGNRPLRARAIETFARDIEEGRWAFNGEAIIVSGDGMLNDGQHRCSAVVKAHKAIKVVLVLGTKRETRTTLDQGTARQIGDYLSMQGHPDSRVLGSVARFGWSVEKYGFVTDSPGMSPTKAQVLEFVHTNGGLAKSVARIPNYGVNKVGGRPVLAFCHWHLTRWGHAVDADAYIEALLNGENLGKRDPRLYVRNRLADGIFRKPAEKIELIVRGWNAHRKDEQVTRIPVLGGRLPDVEA